MDILFDIGVDPAKSEAGVWINLSAKPYHEIDEAEIGARSAIKIGRSSNAGQVRALVKRKSQLRRGLMDGEDDPLVAARFQAESMYGTVIFDWRNIQAGGQDFPFSKQNLIAVFTEPQYVRFKEILAGLIQDEELFRWQQEEATLKN
jgi:hypothetical protein